MKKALNMNDDDTPSKRVVFVRQSRLEKSSRQISFSVLDQSNGSNVGNVQDLQAGLRKQTVHVTNRPARYPPTGVWPFELRADMVAALLDFETTRQLCAAIAADCAPRPGAVRKMGGQIDVVWSQESVREFIFARHHAGRKIEV